MSKNKLKNVKIFTREEMVENRSNIYDHILDTLLELKAPIKILPMKNSLDVYEVRKIKVTGKMNREQREDYSLKYSW